MMVHIKASTHKSKHHPSSLQKLVAMGLPAEAIIKGKGGLLISESDIKEINSCKAPLTQNSLFSGLDRFLNVFILLNDYSQMPRRDQFQEPVQITEFKDILFSYINTIFAYKPKHFLPYNLNYLQ